MSIDRSVPPLSSFPSTVREILRFRDTDRLGHVNNAVFATFCETGRTALLYDPETGFGAPDCEYVIARLELDYLGELNWPGEVMIGTGVKRVGRTSLTLTNAVYDGARAVARAETVIVQIDRQTRAARPLSKALAQRLSTLTLRDAAT